jgi:hypothetical protein
VQNSAHSLEISPSTACRCQSEVLRMKSRHLRWVPHMLTAAQKVMRAELAQSTLRALAKHQHPISISYSQVTRHGCFPPMITEPCGSLPGITLRRLNDHPIPSRILWSQSFSMELVSARSRFFHKDTTWIAQTS